MKKAKLKLRPYAYTCCYDCGNEYGRHRGGASSFWQDTCEICNEIKPVTECRDFGYPCFPGFEKWEPSHNPFLDI